MRTLIVFLGLVLALALAASTNAAEQPAGKPVASAPVKSVQLKPLPPGVVQIQLEDIHCKTCAKKLARKLYTVPGVLRVQSSLKQDLVTITLQKKKKVTPLSLWKAVIAADQAPVELRYASERLTKKHFPSVKTAAKKSKPKH